MGCNIVYTFFYIVYNIYLYNNSSILYNIYYNHNNKLLLVYSGVLGHSLNNYINFSSCAWRSQPSIIIFA